MSDLTTTDLHRLADEYVRAVNAHDVDALIALHSPDFVMHSAQGDAGIEQYRAMMGGFFAAFPDHQSTALDIVAEGDRLVFHWESAGTHTGTEFMGMPITGKAVRFTEVYIRRVENGKLAEGWGLMDVPTFLAQLQ